MNRQTTGLVAMRFFILMAMVGAVVGCSDSLLPLPFTSAPTPVNKLTYEAPVSLVIKTGTLLPGTSIAYGGKTDTGAAKVLITGLVAPKQMADTVDWEGTPVPNVNVKLNMRVATFDDQSITLVGSSHIEISNVTVQPGSSPGTTLMEFNAPVTFSLKKDEMIPGTKLVFVSGSSNGAQFLGLEGYPYRKQLDSLQYLGRLNPKVYVKLDLRVISFSENGAVLGGTANIKVEQ